MGVPSRADPGGTNTGTPAPSPTRPGGPEKTEKSVCLAGLLGKHQVLRQQQEAGRASTQPQRPKDKLAEECVGGERG